MAQRSSNRDRIDRMAQEADVGRKEKEAAAAAKKASPAKKTTKKAASKPVGRTKVVWLLCDQAGRTVETYPYPEEQAARAEAQKRTEETGKTHFVTRGRGAVRVAATQASDLFGIARGLGRGVRRQPPIHHSTVVNRRLPSH